MLLFLTGRSRDRVFNFPLMSTPVVCLVGDFLGDVQQRRAPNADKARGRSAAAPELRGVNGGPLRVRMIGLFIGPVLFAAAYSLLIDWVRQNSPGRSS
jgi:hypothetical protein